MSNIVAPVLPLTAGDTIDFSGAWKSMWTAIESATGIAGVIKLFAIVGVILVLASLIGWLFQKRRGGGVSQGLSGVLVTLIIGIVLVAPNYGIGALLTIVDGIGNAVVKILKLA